MTINKSQGRSFNVVGLRVTDGNNKLFILADNRKTSNILYKEVL